MGKKNIYNFYTWIICSFLFACNSSKEYPSGCSQISDNYYSYLEKSKDTIYSNNLIQKLHNISIKKNDCVYSYMLSSEIYLSLKNYSEAKKDLFNILKINSQNIFALFHLGRINSIEHNYDSAIQYFKDAAKLKSKNGIIIERTREFSEIIEQPYFDIEYSEIIFNNAVASFQAHYLFDANNEFEYCIRNNKKLGESYFYLALIYLEIDRPEDLCKNMLLAKNNGNPNANDYILKYCKDEERK